MGFRILGAGASLGIKTFLDSATTSVETLAEGGWIAEKRVLSNDVRAGNDAAARVSVAKVGSTDLVCSLFLFAAALLAGCSIFAIEASS